MDKVPDDTLSGPVTGTRTARTKFLDVVRRATETNHLELVVDPDGPNSGYAYIQKPDSFTNLYAFHFEFGDTFAVFYLGTEASKVLNPEQRRQVDYKDGEAMELVIGEIKSKIGGAAGDVFPSLSSLSAPTKPVDSQAKAAVQAKQTSSNPDGAAVWGQDEMSIARDRYRYKKPPKKSYLGIVLSVVLVVVLVLTLAPLLQTSGGITECHGGSCQTSTVYYKSVSFNFFGVGGVYVPQSGGWGMFGKGTLQPGNGTLMGGVSLSRFYVTW